MELLTYDLIGGPMHGQEGYRFMLEKGQPFLYMARHIEPPIRLTDEGTERRQHDLYLYTRRVMQHVSGRAFFYYAWHEMGDEHAFGLARSILAGQYGI